MLNKGDTFSGFRIEAENDTEQGKVWIFEKNNRAVVISCRWEEIFTAMSHPHEKERFLDQLAMAVHQKCREHQPFTSTLVPR